MSDCYFKPCHVPRERDRKSEKNAHGQLVVWKLIVEYHLYKEEKLLKNLTHLQ